MTAKANNIFKNLSKSIVDFINNSVRFIRKNELSKNPQVIKRKTEKQTTRVRTLEIH